LLSTIDVILKSPNVQEAPTEPENLYFDLAINRRLLTEALVQFKMPMPPYSKEKIGELDKWFDY
jgi:hypothetical protein